MPLETIKSREAASGVIRAAYTLIKVASFVLSFAVEYTASVEKQSYLKHPQQQPSLKLPHSALSGLGGSSLRNSSSFVLG